MQDIKQLNSKYAIAGQLEFIEGPGGLPFIRINNTAASALVSVYAGQVLSFRPAGEPEDLMFLSKKAYYQTGKAIKGGVPVCWPWFGADPEGLGRAAHGFVRNRMWNVLGTGMTAEGEARVMLGLTDTPETHAVWPHAFSLTLEITIGKSLSLKLATRNTGNESFTVTQALHTYFSVGDIERTSVTGLEEREYIDKAGGGSVPGHQHGAVTINAEVDRIYLDTPKELVIHDAALKRRIRIVSAGSKTAVVWNPWIKITAGMADLESHDYQHFICVETTNAAADIVQVAPGQESSLMAVYLAERD